MGKQRKNQRQLCPQGPLSTQTSENQLLHTTGGLCSEPTEGRTTAARGEVDSVFVTLMLRRRRA